MIRGGFGLADPPPGTLYRRVSVPPCGTDATDCSMNWTEPGQYEWRNGGWHKLPWQTVTIAGPYLTITACGDSRLTLPGPPSKARNRAERRRERHARS